MDLRLNANKIESALLADGRKFPYVKMKIGDLELRSSDAFKYLGLIIDKDMKMVKHVENFLGKAEKKSMAI